MPKKIAKETDQAYLLKVVLYLVLGLVWVRYQGHNVFPLGLALGIAAAQTDHFAIDRKIEYVILLLAALIALAGFGFFLNITSL